MQMTEEQAEKELAEYNRRVNREKGLELAEIRDEGHGSLAGGKVTLNWFVDKPLREYEARENVPAGHFKIKLGREEALLNKEEFLKVFRWVR